MVKKIYNPPMIIKVRAEREALLIRLPRWFVERHKMTSRDYVVFRDLLNDKAELQLWEDHVDGIRKTGKRIRTSHTGR